MLRMLKFTSAQNLIKRPDVKTRALDFDWPGVTKEQARALLDERIYLLRV